MSEFTFDLTAILEQSQAIAAEQAAIAEKEKALKAEREAALAARKQAQAGQLEQLEAARTQLDEEYKTAVQSANADHTTAKEALVAAQASVIEKKKALDSVIAGLADNRRHYQDVSKAVALLGGRVVATGGTRAPSEGRAGRGHAVEEIKSAIADLEATGSPWTATDVIRTLPGAAPSTVYNLVSRYKREGFL